MQLEFATYSDRQDTGLPEARLVNMYPQITPAGPSKSARLPRPGLERAYLLGAAAITGLYQQDGVFGGDLFAICGTGLFRGETSVGTVAAGAWASFAASDTQLVVVSGGHAYCFDGSTTTEVVMPNGESVVAVALLGDRFYYLVEGDDQWYWSDLADATTIAGLAFATADAQPDASVGVGVLADRIYFFGRTSVEPWYQTGDANAPLNRVQGGTYTVGCASGRSIVRADNRLFWLGSDLKFYVIGPSRVSTHAIEEKFRLCETPEDISAFAVSRDGNDFVCVRVPGQGTYALHIESGEWAEWSSFGRATFRGQVGIMAGATAYIGDMFSGAIYRLAEVYADDGEPIERIATVLAPPGVHASIELVAAVGVGLEGNATPEVELRQSDDQGRTFTAWQSRSLGLIGHYSQRVRWNRRGLAKRPRAYQVRCTDPVKTVFVAVEARIV